MSEDRKDLPIKGKVLTHIFVDKKRDEIYFQSENEQWCMWHEEDCCETVVIEDISGDMNDLLGSPLLVAEEYTRSGEMSYDLTFTYTFYRLGTANGFVDIRWYGISNGYYSERVDFSSLTDSQDHYCRPSRW